MLGPSFRRSYFPICEPQQDRAMTFGMAGQKLCKALAWTTSGSTISATRLPVSLSAAGVSDLFVAQMIGHSSPGILQRYAKSH